MNSRLSETSLKTLEDCSHLLQLPVRQHVRVVGHVGAHPHLDQRSPKTHPLDQVSSLKPENQDIALTQANTLTQANNYKLVGAP